MQMTAIASVLALLVALAVPGFYALPATPTVDNDDVGPQLETALDAVSELTDVDLPQEGRTRRAISSAHIRELDPIAEVTMAQYPTVAIQSVQFPGVFLRMDGSEVTHFSGPGAGIVNLQYGAYPYEKFRIHQEDVGYSFESVAFPGVYLRMDGSMVANFLAAGGGVVNCQKGAGPYEKYHIRSYGDNYSIESVQWPGVFLRLDGSLVTKMTGSGGGTVNVQYGAYPYEKVKLVFTN